MRQYKSGSSLLNTSHILLTLQNNDTLFYAMSGPSKIKNKLTLNEPAKIQEKCFMLMSMWSQCVCQDCNKLVFRNVQVAERKLNRYMLSVY